MQGRWPYGNPFLEKPSVDVITYRVGRIWRFGTTGTVRHGPDGISGLRRMNFLPNRHHPCRTGLIRISAFAKRDKTSIESTDFDRYDGTRNRWPAN